MSKITPSPLSLLFSLFLLLTSPTSISATCTFPTAGPSPPHNVKGMFIFGSSYVDNGNNNYLERSFAKVNFPPYGVDFPLGPTGRYTNGKNVIDLLGDELGLPSYIPVFASPDTNGSGIVNGVSFASGGSGILDETGSLVGVISLKQQIKNFEGVTLKELEQVVGCKSSELLANYLFVFGTGGNDFTSNYFPRKNANSNITLKYFTTKLTYSLSLQIQKLYDLGARKFVLMSVYPIGCSPQSKAAEVGKKDCVKSYNKGAVLFNKRLKSLVNKMKQKMPGSNLVFVNAFGVIMDIIQKPSPKGFSDAMTTCCEAAMPAGGGLCKKGGSVCTNRNAQVFFDGVHPTEAVNKLLSKSAYFSNLPTEVYPINIKRLASI